MRYSAISICAGLPLSEMTGDLATYRDALIATRDHFTSLSGNARYVPVDGGHGIVGEYPDLLIDSVNAVLESAVTGSPLTP